VIGVVILVVAFVVGVPVLLMSLGALAAVLGNLLRDDAAERHAGSELVELNR
jgi:hypothetical protein